MHQYDFSVNSSAFCTHFTWCLGRPTMDGKTALGASSPANPALHMPEPLSTTKAATSSSHMMNCVCWQFKIQRKWDLTVSSSIDVWSKSQDFTSLYHFSDGQTHTHLCIEDEYTDLKARLRCCASTNFTSYSYAWASCPWNN